MIIDYNYEPRRAIFFEDVKSNYASIECVERKLHPLTTSLCVMSRSDNSYGLILASSPKFKEVFGKSNVSRAADLPFLIESRKFNYQSWYAKHTDIHGQRTEPTIQYVAFIESWAKRTYCTWYVYNREYQIGHVIASNLGNGGSWGANAKAQGYKTSGTPHAGDMVSFPPGVAGASPIYGHVAFVEYVNPDGSFLISEMNVLGLDKIDYRVVGSPAGCIFINPVK